MWTLLREVSLRHLRHAPLRTGLVVVGIALGVAMLCAVLSTNAVLIAAFEDMVDRVAGKADLTVAGTEAGIPSSLTGQIADLPGVDHAAAMLEVVTRTPDGQGGSLLVLGVDFLGDTFFLPFAQEGKDRVVEDPLAFVNDPTAILVSEKLAKVRGLKLGDALPLLTATGPTKFYVRGLLKDEGPAASFGGQVVVMFIDAAQVSFARGYAVDRIDVVIEQGAELEPVRAQIEELIKGRASVEAPQGRVHRMVAALWTFKSGLHMSGMIALCVGMFLIFNAVSISVAQRRREVGTLRALGVTQRGMVSLFCIEASVMAALGVTLGLIMSRALARFAVSSVQESINQFVMPLRPPVPELSWDIILWGVLAGFGSTLVAAYFPARATNKISPAEAVRSSRSTAFVRAVRVKRLSLVSLFLIGVSCLLSLRGGETNGYLAVALLNLAAALLVPLAIKLIRRALGSTVEATLGISGRLGVDNVERVLGRSAITVVALMLAVAMSMSVGGYAQSFEASLLSWAEDAFPADAVITSGSPLLDRQHLPFSESVLDEIAGVPGLASSAGIRITLADVGSHRMEVQAYDSRANHDQAARKQRWRSVIDGPERLGRDALYEKPRVMVSENAAQFEKLSAGDTLWLDTPSGRRAFEVYAVVVDYSTDQGCILMDRRWFREYWKDELVDAVSLYFSPGAQPEQVMTTLRDKLKANDGLFVSLQDVIRDQLREAAQNLFAYAKAPELITLIVAIMGVIGTMLAAVIDRIREIGMMRAIGATRRQIATSLITEAGFMGFGAALFGVIAGVPLGYMLLKVVGAATSGWDLPYDFPLETALRTSLLVTFTAALAGYVPARKVAVLDVKEALSYE
jgi:putative ABC transport system permease protein